MWLSTRLGLTYFSELDKKDTWVRVCVVVIFNMCVSWHAQTYYYINHTNETALSSMQCAWWNNSIVKTYFQVPAFQIKLSSGLTFLLVFLAKWNFLLNRKFYFSPFCDYYCILMTSLQKIFFKWLLSYYELKTFLKTCSLPRMIFFAFICSVMPSSVLSFSKCLLSACFVPYPGF